MSTLDEVAPSGRSLLIRSVWTGERYCLWPFVAFALTAALGAPAVLAGSFFLLCAVECTALPWLMFVVGPVAVVGLVLPALIWLGVGSFRSARQLPAGPRVLVRAAIVGAVVWAPLLWYFAMRVLLSDS